MNLLKKYNIVLASKSPRRSKLLREMGFSFKVMTMDVEESFPDDILSEDVPEYLAIKKASPFTGTLADNQLVITADTIVIFENKILGKPKDLIEAKKTLQTLSGKSHLVISGVQLMSSSKTQSFSDSSIVHFSEIPDEAIDYYLEIEPPLDKAGSYGIQGWIGHNFIDRIEGSYTNIMGLPTEKLFKALSSF